VRRIPLAAVSCSAALVLAPCAAHATTFAFTGTEQTYTVPSGVTMVTISAVGAAGGANLVGGGLTGGRGAAVSGVVGVSPGQVDRKSVV